MQQLIRTQAVRAVGQVEVSDAHMSIPTKKNRGESIEVEFEGCDAASVLAMLLLVTSDL